MKSIYDFTVKCMDGSQKSLSDYRNQVLLIVNTASKCGFTPHLGELETLYKRYKDKGFLVLGFPCNQFLEQDPESNEVIHAFCSTKYGVTFPLFSKAEVKGSNADPLFQYLISEKKFQGFDNNCDLAEKLDKILSKEDSAYKQNNDIKWNFTKFLIGKDGNVIERFEPTADMGKLENAVKKALEESKHE